MTGAFTAAGLVGGGVTSAALERGTGALMTLGGRGRRGSGRGASFGLSSGASRTGVTFTSPIFWVATAAPDPRENKSSQTVPMSNREE